MALHEWMSVEEAIERLQAFRDGAAESASAMNGGSFDWFLDRAGDDVPFKVTPFDQNCVFAHAMDVVAFDVALAALRERRVTERADKQDRV